MDPAGVLQICFGPFLSQPASFFWRAPGLKKRVIHGGFVLFLRYTTNFYSSKFYFFLLIYNQPQFKLLPPHYVSWRIILTGELAFVLIDKPVLLTVAGRILNLVAGPSLYPAATLGLCKEIKGGREYA